MITFHRLNNSRSQRVLWLLEGLGGTPERLRYTYRMHFAEGSALLC